MSTSKINSGFLLGLLILIVISTVFLLNSIGATSVNDEIIKAEKYFKEKSYRLALEIYEKVIPDVKNENARAEYLYKTAYCYFMIKDYNKSDDTLQKALKLKDSGDIVIKAKVLKARVLYEENHYSNHDIALKLLREAEKSIGKSKTNSYKELLIDIYNTKLDAFYYRYWDGNLWIDEAFGDAKKLADLIETDDKKAEIFFTLADKVRYSNAGDKKKDYYGEVLTYLVDNYNKSKYAAPAYALLGRLSEGNGDYLKALEYYEIAVMKYPDDKETVKNCQSYIKNITSEQARIFIPQVFKPGDEIKLKLTTRNINTVDFQVYKVDLYKILNKYGNIEFVDLYDFDKKDLLPLKWKLDIPDDGTHQILSRDMDVDLQNAGAYILEGRSSKVKARALVLITDIAVVMKRSNTEILVWVTDALNSSIVPDAEVLIGNKKDHSQNTKVTRNIPDYYKYKSLKKAKTDDAGIYLLEKPGLKFNQDEMICLVKRGNSYALTESWYSYYFGRNDSYYLYSQTDRPVYRPDQEVNFKAILRYFKSGKFENIAGKNVNAIVYDAKGEEIFKKKLLSNEFGTIHDSIKIKDKASLGEYRIEFEWVGGTHYQYFRVEEYKRPEYSVSITPAEKQYKLGKEVSAKINAKYYFGEPVKNAEVKYKIMQYYYYPYYHFYDSYHWFRSSSGRDYAGYDDYRSGIRNRGSYQVGSGTGKTDENGDLIIKFKTAIRIEDKRDEKFYHYSIHAEVTDKSRRMIEGQGSVMVGETAFRAYLNTGRYIYSPDDKILIDVITQNLNNEPVETKGKLILETAKYNSIKKDYDYKQIKSWKLQTDASGKAEYTISLKQTGYFRLVYQTVDQYDKQIKGYHTFWVADDTFHGAFYKYQGLEIVTDKDSYVPGDTAQVLINGDMFSNSNILMTVENDSIHDYRVVHMKGNSKMIAVKIQERFNPNVWFKALGVHDFKTWNAEKEITIPPDGKFLNVTLTGTKKSYLPGEKAEFYVKTTDKNGNPVSTEIAVGVVDSSIYYIAPDRTPDIRQFFYSRFIQNSIRTSTSFDFRFRSRSQEVPESESFGMADGEMKAMAPSAAPMERAVKGKLGKKDGDSDDLAEPVIRKDFRETAYWGPVVRTGPDGKGKVEFSFPDSLTTFRLIARAVSKDTLVGNVTEDIITKKNVIVRLQTPRFFTERDEVVLSSIVHNYSDDTIKAKVYLKVEGIELRDNKEQWVKVKKGDEVRVDFIADIRKPGLAKITAFALAENESDAMELKFPVIPHGVEKRFAENGTVEKDVLMKFTVPSERKPGSGSLKINITPSIGGVILDSLDYLVDYPYGCVEQTMSRFLPAAIAAKTLEKFGVKKESLEKKLPDVMKQSLKRLYDFQHSDGGWGWWKDDSSTVYMTGYVLYGLQVAAEAGYEIDSSRIERARKYVLDNLDSHLNHLNDLTFALHALSYDKGTHKTAEKALNKVLDEREKLNAYSRALMALVFANYGDQEHAELMLRNLYDFARNDKENGTISWAENERYWWYWYNDSVETTAMALRAYLKLENKSEYIPKIVKWLVNNREGIRWKSTRDSAIAILALTEYITKTSEMNPEYTAKLFINGKQHQKWNFTKKDIFDYGKVVEIEDKDLPNGNLEVKITKEGKGELYYSTVLQYYTKEEDITGVANAIEVKRSYYLITKKGNNESRKLLKNGADLKSGDEIEVELSLKSDNDYEYLIFEDYKPAGAEAYALISGYTWSDGMGYQREMRDEKVVFFINRLRQGSSVIRYRLRAEVPGKFHTMPTIGYAMYCPRIYSVSDEFRVNITD